MILPVSVVFDTLQQPVLRPLKDKPKMTPAEMMTVAVVAARSFQNTLERALLVLRDTGDIPPARCLSVSRFNRRRHRQGDVLAFCLATLMTVAREGRRLIPIRKTKRLPHHWLDDLHRQEYRPGIETVKSPRESMGVQRLRARTNTGFELKIHRSLLALYQTQLIANTN